jgi:hypothetical protein
MNLKRKVAPLTYERPPYEKLKMTAKKKAAVSKAAEKVFNPPKQKAVKKTTPKKTPKYYNTYPDSYYTP